MTTHDHRILVDRLKDYAEHPSMFTDISPTDADAAADLIESLLAERDAATADAARYRFIRGYNITPAELAQMVGDFAGHQLDTEIDKRRGA